MKYRDNMTAQELARFMAEVDALHAAYAAADAYAAAATHDALNAEPVPDEWEDENETLRRAALDHRGRP
jgi:hypothetical protein